MKTTLITILLLACAAASAKAEADYGNIHEGNVEASGRVGFANVSSGGSSFTQVFLSPAAHYFFADRFSVGLVTGYSYSSAGSGATSVSVGPAVKYYIWGSDRLAAFLGQDFSYNKFFGFDSFFDMTTSLGLPYFVTPSVALGPTLEYGHRFEHGNVSSLDLIQLALTFAIYL